MGLFKTEKVEPPAKAPMFPHEVHIFRYSDELKVTPGVPETVAPYLNDGKPATRLVARYQLVEILEVTTAVTVSSKVKYSEWS